MKKELRNRLLASTMLGALGGSFITSAVWMERMSNVLDASATLPYALLIPLLICGIAYSILYKEAKK